MSPPLTALLGAGLGALGALAHLALLWLRARAALAGRPGLSLLGYPLGLAAVAGALLAAAGLGPTAVFTAAAALLGTRGAVLLALAPRQGEGAR